MLNKDKVALTPPMGWNSWDCYGAAVNEEQLLGNAEYMRDNLKQYGWQYVVCDIQWYEPKAKNNDYNNFTELCMDEYSRLIPAENRFPSSKGGRGFKPIADKIHAMGLKFGIHIMRGIPRQAVHSNTKILGSEKTARQIAHHFSLCPWNTDMYGVNPNADGAQQYYNSLFELYASWGVDFVKVDDIANTEFKPHDPYSAKAEIEMIRKAIDSCGRDMVLSLSPGPAQLERAEHLCENANMWRMTGDFWDVWDKLYEMFDRAEKWYPYVKEGCWPDCDMLPLGNISRNGTCHGPQDRMSQFTHDEQITLMTLWCIFRSPLMFGGELRNNDEWTLSLITNEEVLNVNQHSHSAHPAGDYKGVKIWLSQSENDEPIIAVFNTAEESRKVTLDFEKFNLNGSYTVRDLWAKTDIAENVKSICTNIDPHGAVLYLLK
ncbi:MAG: glycoside hydrolase family 27 protein [Clostridia bacterium]|nr:glycoside hydrolase family 27 protein [Clostridia bacterium]